MEEAGIEMGTGVLKSAHPGGVLDGRPRHLAQEDEAARQARLAHGALRILWVKIGGLWPANTGGRLRSFHLIQELARHHEVSVMTTHLPQEDPAELSRQLPQCRRVLSLPYRPAKLGGARFLLALLRSWFSRLPVDLHKNRVPALRREVDRTLASGEFDLCIADFLVAVPNVRMKSNVPVVFFSHNVEYMIWRRLGRNAGSALRRALLELEWRKMRRCEARACRQARLTVAVSATDRDQLRRDAPQSVIRDVPTGVDVGYFRPAPDVAEEPLELVFTGSMDWHPNEDAILWFARSILPLVRQELPGVTCTVVGRNPSAQVREAGARAGIRVTGTVDDVRPFVHRAALYVVPLRVGGGTRIKIFEALAMGKAVLSTTVGAEGLPLEEGVHVMRADSAEAFAAAIVDLLRDDERRRALGEAGRHLMEERYSWARVASVFEAHCREAVAG